MIVTLNNVIPQPIFADDVEVSCIWGKSGVQFLKGNAYLIVGNSGKGKTTLLSYLYGLRKDYSGSILIDESDSGKIDLGRWTRLRRNYFSYVFQDLKLFDELTVLQNIKLKNNLTGFKSSREISEMAELLGVEPFLDKKVKRISLGQAQRVAIIRALCQPYRFILLDEVFSHLDTGNFENAIDLIMKEASAQEAGIIMTDLNNRYTCQFDKVIQI